MTRRSRLLTAIVVACAFAAIGVVWAARTSTITVVARDDAGEPRREPVGSGPVVTATMRCPGVFQPSTAASLGTDLSGFSSTDGTRTGDVGPVFDRCTRSRRERLAVLVMDLVVAIVVVAGATLALLRDPDEDEVPVVRSG